MCQNKNINTTKNKISKIKVLLENKIAGQKSSYLFISSVPKMVLDGLWGIYLWAEIYRFGPNTPK